MENPPIRKKPTKRSSTQNTKNKPVKVIYISNPMKVEICASRFRTLVQELTGQDAHDLPDPTKFARQDDIVDSETVLDVPAVVEAVKEKAAESDGSGGEFGDEFSVELIENKGPNWYY